MEWKQLILETYRKMRTSPYGWRGDFLNWEEAKKHAGSYDAGSILDKVQESSLKVRDHQAAFERDSVLFMDVQYSWPLLAAILWVAAKNKGSLKVADFGGSLGSSYFQNKLFLDSLSALKWNVIEQPHFVQSGIRHFRNDRLEFYESLDQCIREQGIPDMLIMSCVLPYLEEPYKILDIICTHKIPHILIDNTFFNYENRDRICVQTVPPEIYEASYPCWLLSLEHVKRCVQTQYEILTEHKNDSIIYVDGKKINYEGFLATRIE